MALPPVTENRADYEAGPTVPVLDMAKLGTGDEVFGELETMVQSLGDWLDVVQTGLEEVDFDWDDDGLADDEGWVAENGDGDAKEADERVMVNDDSIDRVQVSVR